jgi:hypothetical protein
MPILSSRNSPIRRAKLEVSYRVAELRSSCPTPSPHSTLYQRATSSGVVFHLPRRLLDLCHALKSTARKQRLSHFIFTTLLQTAPSRHDLRRKGVFSLVETRNFGIHNSSLSFPNFVVFNFRSRLPSTGKGTPESGLHSLLLSRWMHLKSNPSALGLHVYSSEARITLHTSPSTTPHFGEPRVNRQPLRQVNLLELPRTVSVCCLRLISVVDKISSGKSTDPKHCPSPVVPQKSGASCRSLCRKR